MNDTPTDTQLIERIRAGGRKRESAVRQLINLHHGYISTISQKTGIPLEQAKDVFTDAIIVLVDHIAQKVFRADSKISTYLYKICYHKGIDQARYRAVRDISFVSDLPEISDRSQDLLQLLEMREDSDQVREAITSLGEPCHQVLLDWGFWGFSMSEVAERSGLRDAQQAKKQKYRCLKRLMRFLSPQLHQA